MRKKDDKFLEDGMSDGVSGIHAHHPNRNEDKIRERKTPDSRRGSITRSQEITNDSQPEHDNHVRQSGNANPDFFVLIISKKNAKFFRGDASGLRHVNITELPNGINDVVHSDEKEEKQNIVMYLKEVDKTL